MHGNFVSRLYVRNLTLCFSRAEKVGVLDSCLCCKFVVYFCRIESKYGALALQFDCLFFKLV
jgi:hypothetical protein